MTMRNFEPAPLPPTFDERDEAWFASPVRGLTRRLRAAHSVEAPEAFDDVIADAWFARVGS